MSISTLRRQVKNVALNFSDAQVKVREATSNDPWGPTTALMSEIADLTHNPLSFTEIMSMIWKRLNDHGKNWRHVYKSLVLLDYLIKCGSEKVAQQCRENIYSIETLRDFQHIEDNRDQGLNVREKAKQMVSLLNDEERLKNERARFLLTRKRFIQNGSGISSDGAVRSSRRTGPDRIGGGGDYELEEAVPSSLGEEEMQLQIAIALSKEESEKEKELRRGDDIRLQLAIEESKREMPKELPADAGQKMIPGSSLSKNALEDLLSLGLGEPQAPSTSAQAYAANNDPWSPIGTSSVVTPAPTSNNQIIVYPSLQPTSHLATQVSATAADPWAPLPASNSTQLSQQSQAHSASAVAPAQKLAQEDPWALFEASSNNVSNGAPPMAFNVPGGADSSRDPILSPDDTHNTNNPIGQQRPNVKTPETFLGENSSLVNLDNLMGPSVPAAKNASNPFMIGASGAPPAAVLNPFAAQQRPSPSLNEMIATQRSGSTNLLQQTPNNSASNPLHQSQPPTTNPFSP